MNKAKIFGFVFSAFVVVLLLMAGPAEGLSLKLGVNNVKPEKGDLVTFNAEVEITNSEFLSLEKLVLEMDGPEDVSCAFDVDGVALDGCKNIRITKTGESSSLYGYHYGYGYGVGKLVYKIEIDTSGLDTGSYSTSLKVKSSNQIYSIAGKEISVKSSSSKSSGGREVCRPEWSCSEWSGCSNGMQFRTCYRSLDYCQTEPQPAESRICLSEDLGKAVLSTASVIPEEKESVVSVDSLKSNWSFVVILLLMNCIITLTNIIVKVEGDRYEFARRRAARKRKMMPSKLS